MVDNNEFRGIFPFLVIPLDESGRLKEQVFADLVDHPNRKGIRSLTPLGSTGEAPYVDWETKWRTIEVVVKSKAGHVPGVVGVCNVFTHLLS